MSHILLVDDNLIFTMALAHLLRQLGYEVTTAHNGEAALDHREKHVDLVIADLSSLGEDSLSALREFRHNFAPRRIIAFATGSQSFQALRGSGVRHTFSKPFDTQKLLQAIEGELTPPAS